MKRIEGRESEIDAKNLAKIKRVKGESRVSTICTSLNLASSRLRANHGETTSDERDVRGEKGGIIAKGKKKAKRDSDSMCDAMREDENE